MDLYDREGVEITNKSYSVKKLKATNTSLKYGNFLKSATLLANVGKEEEIDGHVSTNDIEIKPFTVMSDEDLFKACDGRTAHKGARHGLNMTGKLQRIAEQEKELLARMKEKQNKHDVFREPQAKKQKKNPLAELNSSIEETSDDARLPVQEVDYVLQRTRKRKKIDQKQEQQLVKQINSIGLDEAALREENPYEKVTTHVRRGTPTRRKKKPLRFHDTKLLEAILEAESSTDMPKRKKKKKGKRRHDEDDAAMAESSEKQPKAKKVKLNDSYEASDDDEDVADRINAEQAAHQLQKSMKLNKKSKKKKQKQRSNEAAAGIAEML